MKHLQYLRRVCQVLCRFPSVFTFSISFPTDEVLESTIKHLRIMDVVNLIFFLSVNGNRVRWQGC